MADLELMRGRVTASCSGAGPGWRALAVREHGARLNVAVLGDGAPGVVLANQSGNDPCAWVPLARELAGKGMRALVFEYDDNSRADREVLAAARALRAAGVRHVAAIGASLGGRAVVQAAARDRGALTAAVSLSAGVNRMLLVPGGDHGVQLLSDANGSRVRAAIFAFLRANAG
jgi:dienelactone hydrolase